MANQNEKIECEDEGNVNGFYDHMKKLMDLSDRTMYHYMTYHKHFMDQEITQQSITEFLKKKKNNSVVRGYIVAYLEYLGRRKDFELPKIKSGTKKKKLPQLLTKEDVEEII